MKSFLPLLFYFTLTGKVNSQNLVPNFSFEELDTCPDEPDEIQKANGWTKFSALLSTPDYYNSCAPVGFFNVPYSGNGYQQAHRNCDAYIGIVTFATPTSNDREYAGIQLTQPLTIGEKYFISFHTVMGEEILGSNQFGMPSNGIGIRLSTIAYNPTSPCPVDNFAHLHASPIINDTVNWNRISGSIIADSAYDYVIIGNFNDDVHTDTMHYNCDSCLNYLSYYYVDDICVTTDSTFANGGIDSLPCDFASDVQQVAFETDLRIFPNPVFDLLTIEFKYDHEGVIMLYNALGEQVFSMVIDKQQSAIINFTNYPSGIYFLKTSGEKDFMFSSLILKF